MPRISGTWNPKIELGKNFADQVTLITVTGAPQDISGYEAVGEFYENAPIRDPATGLATVPPILQLTTPGYHAGAVAWPVSQSLLVPVGTDGQIQIDVPDASVWLLSPTNTRRRLYFSILLVGLQRIAVTKGRCRILPSGVVTP